MWDHYSGWRITGCSWPIPTHTNDFFGKFWTLLTVQCPPVPCSAPSLPRPTLAALLFLPPFWSIVLPEEFWESFRLDFDGGVSIVRIPFGWKYSPLLRQRVLRLIFHDSS